MSLSIRTWTVDDVDMAGEIIRSAFNSPPDYDPDHRRYLQLQPDGWLLATLDGKPAGVGGIIDYGPFSYIGLMGVLPTMQGRGIGGQVMTRLLAWADARGCPTVLLDASPAGAPLYSSLGFVQFDETVRLRRETGTPLAHPLSARVSLLRAADLPELVAFDTPYFGAERGAVLASYLADYPQRSFVIRNEAGQISGYLIAQPGVIGPWMAESVDEAEQLLLHALSLPFAKDVVTLTVLSANSDVMPLLTRYGFQVAYRNGQRNILKHMRLGPAPSTLPAKLYAQASLAIG